MADDLKRVGLIFKADGTVDFKKSLSEINSSIQENRSAFKLAQSQWDKNTKTAEKLSEKQKYMAKQTKDYTDKVTLLEIELSQLENAEKRDENAINKKKNQLNQAKASLNNYKKGLEEVEKQLKFGTAQLQEYAKKIENIGEKATELGKKATKGITTPIAAIGTAGIKAAADFEEGMSNVAATMGITAEEINSGSEEYEKLSKAAREMGSSTKYSATEAAEALNYLALAGYDTDKSIETLPVILNLAAAGNMDLAAASDMVTDSMSALGLQTNESKSFVDKMAKTAQKSNTSVAQLGEGILTVGGTAKMLKGGVDELNTVLGILADNGTKGAEGGTALRNMILSLAAPTETAAIAIENLGLQVFDAEGNMRGLDEIFNDLNQIMSTMTQGEQTRVLNKIFNKVDLKSVNALLANSGERFSELSGYIKEANGASDEMAETMQNNLNGRISELKSAMEEAAISIGEVLLPIISDLVEHINGWTNEFNGLNEEQKNTIVTIGLVLAAIGPMLVIFGTVAGSVSKIISLTTNVINVASKIPGVAKTIGVGAKALWGIISANPIGAVIVVVTALIAIFVTLYNKCEWFRNGVNKIWDSIKGYLNGVKEWMKGVLNFEWKLPKIKLPHFSISGSFSLNPPSVPKLGVSWYWKGVIFKRRTILNGGIGVGDANNGSGDNPEAIAPIDLLRSYIREENASNNHLLAQMIKEAIAELSIVAENNIYLGDKKFFDVITDMVIKKINSNINDKRFAKGLT